MKITANKIMTVIVGVFLFFWILMCVFFACGCSIYWTDHVFIATLGKEIKAGEVLLIAEPNSLYIGAEQPESKTDKVTVVTPGVLIKTINK